MLQETTAAAAAQTGGSNAAALSQMGFGNLLQEMISTPGHYAVSWAVLITLTLMSVLSIYWIVTNFIKNMRLKGTSDRVISTFWETPNAQDAIRFMEEQPRSEPFSKIALDAAQAAAHHQRHEGSRLVESLNRSEFVDRALRQGVTRESSRLLRFASGSSTLTLCVISGAVIMKMISSTSITSTSGVTLMSAIGPPPEPLANAMSVSPVAVIGPSGP